MTDSKYLLGYDIGSSSVKATLIDAISGEVISSAYSPKEEMRIIAHEFGWAEQDPNEWWNHLILATREIKSASNVDPYNIVGIGISYQMHGLVTVDENLKVLRPSIIWCDSRAVNAGNKAFEDLGSEFCLSHLLNSPGNFTASKLRWVKENEPEIYNKIHKIMLPGDFIAAKLTGEIKTTISGLSEGILWDFKEKEVSNKLLDYYALDSKLIPEIVPTFSEQGRLTSRAAEELGLVKGIKVGYRAGDQPNNAFSLNVLNPGEVAATAGTSGVIYGITDKIVYDQQSRVNSFAHVNYSNSNPSLGVLLCINGTGILNSWLRNNLVGGKYTYDEMNNLGSKIKIGSEGITTIPYGNGAERSLANKDVRAHFIGLNFNKHTLPHIFRSIQEGIAFSFNYGLNIMKGMGMEVQLARAGKANMFMSPLFAEAIANTCNISIELYNTDGAQGAARGAGVGTGFYESFDQAFKGLNKLSSYTPEKDKTEQYGEAYNIWERQLNKILEA